MATSGSYDWKLNRDQIITAALRKLAVLGSGGTASSAQLSDGVDALNAILKAFHADGMPLWAITSTSFNTVDGTDTYTVGISQTINTVPPLKIIQAFRTPSGQAQVPLNIYTRYDFNILPTSSSTTGMPVALYYQNTGDATQRGTIKLWPTPDDSTTSITIHYQRPFTDMDNTTDDLDFPNYWTQAIIYSLAWALSPEYGIPPTDRNILAQEAKYWKDQALGYGTEEGSYYFQPDSQG